MESEISSLRMYALSVRVGPALRLPKVTLIYLTSFVLLGLNLAGCDSETAARDGSDGTITNGVDMSIDDTREVSVPQGDAGVINQCPEESEDSCETAIFSDCVAREGSNGAALIRGTVILEDSVICDGDVLIDRTSRSIICAGDDCSTETLAGDATVICADVILPGLIDPHNHMSYNTLPPWRSGGQLFQNRNQ